MTATQHAHSHANHRDGLSYGQKISLAAGSLSALYLLPTVAQGSIVYVNNNPVSLAMSSAYGTVNWDVDGNGSPDFRLWKSGSTNTGSIFFSSSGLNGQGLVGPNFHTDNVQALHKGFVVGPTLTNNYVWGSRNYSYRNAMQTYPVTSHGQPAVGGPAFWIGYDFNFNFKVGDNYIGFRFLSPGNTGDCTSGDCLYGWADINFDTTQGIVTIKDWAYNDTPNSPIHVADVPEPSTPALTLLGLGAAGLRAWRARKRERAEATA